MSEFLDELKPYLEPNYGVVLLTPGERVDNPSLFTLHAVNLSRRLYGAPSPELFINLFRFVAACQGITGMPRRWPEDLGDTSWDEAIAQAAGNSARAKIMWKRGLHDFFCYDNANPGHISFQFCFARNICFVPFLSACSSHWTAPFLAPIWCLGLLISPWTRRESTSGKLLMDAQIPYMKGLPFVDLSVWIWEKIMGWKYQGRKDLYGIYFPAGHPLITFQREDFNGD